MSGVLTSRPVEARDLAAICGFPRSPAELSLLSRGVTYPLTPEKLRTLIDKRSDSTVALYDGAVAGFANLYGLEPGAHCSIGNVIVDPARRGKGVARYLIRSMIGLAAARHKVAEVRLVCFNENTAGLLLYTSLGFQPFAIEERRRARGPRQAAIRMRAVIGGPLGA